MPVVNEGQTKESVRAEWDTHIPSMYLSTQQKAYAGKSRSAAIKAKCLDCVCWQRNEITLCEVVTCPLWEVRPYQSQKSPSKIQRKRQEPPNGWFGRGKKD